MWCYFHIGGHSLSHSGSPLPFLCGLFLVWRGAPFSHPSVHCALLPTTILCSERKHPRHGNKPFPTSQIQPLLRSPEERRRVRGKAAWQLKADGAQSSSLEDPRLSLYKVTLGSPPPTATDLPFWRGNSARQPPGKVNPSQGCRRPHTQGGQRNPHSLGSSISQASHRTLNTSFFSPCFSSFS